MVQTFKCNSVNSTDDGMTTVTLTGVLAPDAALSTRKSFLNVVVSTVGCPYVAGNEYTLDLTPTLVPPPTT